MNTAGMMSWGAVALFLSVLLIFIGLDLYMLFTLLHPGDERGQLVVWKASAYTLLATSGALMLEVIETFVRAQVMSINPLVHLVVTGITYFVVLLYFRRKLGG
ncbi:MAG: hypothetical protein MR579_02540 [Bacteroidales bacterium]|nr:hypothetical protein [Bacteroidales bacterium]